jgi:flagellar P-ring protein precursor FlgI
MKTACVFCTLLFAVSASGASRVKEIATVEGVRDNQLVGYGLVVGLNGTGDRRQTVFSAQSVTNLLERMGVTVPAAAIRVNNVAAAMVTGTLPPFATHGSKIDVTVAAMGDASSLQGGLLILTSLRGADGQVYGVAQGPVVTGAFVAGNAQAKQTLNHPTVGRIPSGATVERAAPLPELNGTIRLQLKKADFTTSARLTEAINQQFNSPVARAENAGVVSLSVPDSFKDRTTAFLASVERVSVETDTRPRIVINERTGTVVMGKDVQILPVAVMHGALTVEIQTELQVSQPKPFAQGNTEVVPQTSVGIKEVKAKNLMLKQGSTVEELVQALVSIGSTSRDVVAILQAMQAAGALDADLEVL